MRARAVAAIVLSGALAAGLAGCNLVTPVATLDSYEPSDGVSLSVGDLELRNVLVVSEDGKTGSLIATAVNTTASDIDFTLQWKAGGSWREVELTALPNGRTDFGHGEGDRVHLDAIGTIPGGLIDAVVHIADGQGSILIPVLDTTLPEYRI